MKLNEDIDNKWSQMTSYCDFCNRTNEMKSSGIDWHQMKSNDTDIFGFNEVIKWCQKKSNEVTWF